MPIPFKHPMTAAAAVSALALMTVGCAQTDLAGAAGDAKAVATPTLAASASQPAASAPTVARQVTPAPANAPASRGQRRRAGGEDGAVSQSAIERAAIQWQRSGQAADLVGVNGTVMYAYGQSRPVIHCTPLHLCVIQLLKGEQVTDYSIGDSVRWRVAVSRAGDMPVVVVKPVTVGLETNLTLLTDAGRVYYMTLQSRSGHNVALAQFYSPEDIIERIQTREGQLKAQAQAAQETKDATLGRIDPATLDFRYTCSGDAPFRPTEVFSGNGHVYLKMPENMKYGDAPAIFDTSAGQTQLLNSRYARGYQVLDGLPEKFKLTVGVGGAAQSVDCAHGKTGAAGHGHASRWNDSGRDGDVFRFNAPD